MSTDILVHTEANVCTITLNRPAKKNAFTAAMYQAMTDALLSAQADTAVRVVLFQGQETFFSAGNDMADFLNDPPLKDDAPVFVFLRALAHFPKPIIAAVAGPAVGVSTTMLLHCDLVLAGDNAAFSVPFVNLGLCPEAGSSLLLPRLMGHQRASEALLLGEAFYAEAALEIGLVNRVVPPTELHAYAQAQAAKLAAKPLASLMTTKRLLRQAALPEIDARMLEEQAALRELFTAPAAQEAFQAFLEKRKPDFSAC